MDEFAEQNFSHPASIDPMEANKIAEQNFSLPTHMDLTELKDTAKEENKENEGKIIRPLDDQAEKRGDQIGMGIGQTSSE